MAKNNYEVTGWTGWIGFASVMLYLAGFFHIIAGFTALFNDKLYVLTPTTLWTMDITSWGWVHVIGGILAIIAASSLLYGNTFGRIFAIIIAVLSALANLAFIPIYPIWSIIIMVIDALVIYAVVVHADEMKALR
jgi:hypothetical protein